MSNQLININRLENIGVPSWFAEMITEDVEFILYQTLLVSPPDTKGIVTLTMLGEKNILVMHQNFKLN